MNVSTVIAFRDNITPTKLSVPKELPKKTNINADEALKAVFGSKNQVTMFEMTKLVSAHVK